MSRSIFSSGICYSNSAISKINSTNGISARVIIVDNNNFITKKDTNINSGNIIITSMAAKIFTNVFIIMPLIKIGCRSFLSSI